MADSRAAGRSRVLNKISMSWFAGGLALGILLSERRGVLATRGPWLAAAIAGIVFTPHLLWQVAHGWPTLEFMRNASAEKMVAVSPLEFLGNQLIVMNPFTLPLSIAGLVFTSRCAAAGAFARSVDVRGDCRAARVRRHQPRELPRPRLSDAARRRRGRNRARRRIARPAWDRAVLLAVMLVAGFVTAPLALPLLEPERYAGYAAALGVAPPVEEKHDQAPSLPQHLADRHGWIEITDTIAAVFEGLPADERARAGIFAGNYGEAGAIDLLGRRRGLPAAVSGHNSYWLWGPGERSGEVMVVFGVPRERLGQLFGRSRRWRASGAASACRSRTTTGLRLPRAGAAAPEMWESAPSFYR